jgi:WG containing repeat
MDSSGKVVIAPAFLAAGDFSEGLAEARVSGTYGYIDVTGRFDTIHFHAQDSRLYMKTQAMDRQGKWQDIEHLYSSWCGNSYHELSLPPGQYWSFTAPVYAGDIPVKMRIALTWQRDRNGSREPAEVYSPVFEGKVNPAQFWRKPDFHADNIMNLMIY